MNIRSILRGTAASVALAAAATGAGAHQFFSTGSCPPGLKWDASKPVKVRLLIDSYYDYLAKRGAGTLMDLTRIDRDIKAVIALYNTIPGNGLVLEQDVAIVGDSNLDDPANDNFGVQTIVIGFTDATNKNSPGAEAWTPNDTKDVCTMVRAHVIFNKSWDWVFGPPDSIDFPSGQDGRGFYTASQPGNPATTSGPKSFLGILTHEMGHAVGLAHTLNGYAQMAQDVRTWIRGKDALVTRLLPDDTAGVLALYGKAGGAKPLDLSVSNTWVKTADDQAASACPSQLAAVDEAAAAASRATGMQITSTFPAASIDKGPYASYFLALAQAQATLETCVAALNAYQQDNCLVSSRAEDWAPTFGKPPGLCGVNAKGSAYAPVSNRVCPGGEVQMRYALNNHTTARDVLVKAEAWFTTGTGLNTYDGSALQSPDIRHKTVKAAASAITSEVFRVPTSAKSGQTYHVFARAVPYDPSTGASLWASDIDPWNNAAMMGGTITVDPKACP